MEFVNHVFVSCPYTSTISIWSLHGQFSLASLGTLSPSNIVKFFIFPQCHLKIPTNEEHKFTLFASILFVKIWKIRNQTIFAGHTRTQRKVLKRLSVLTFKCTLITYWLGLNYIHSPLVILEAPSH